MTQEKLILDWLEQGNTITPLEALNRFGCLRLGARIWDLRQKGFNIQSCLVKRGNKHFEQYWLVMEPQDVLKEKETRESNLKQEITTINLNTTQKEFAFV